MNTPPQDSNRAAVASQFGGLIGAIVGVALLVLHYAGPRPAAGVGLVLVGALITAWGVLREAGRL